MDEWLCSSTHNKDDVKALDKCAPPGRFILFVPSYAYWRCIFVDSLTEYICFPNYIHY